jgi:hypothetical protein
MSTVPGIQEAEVGGSLEPRNSGLVLANVAKPYVKRRKKKWRKRKLRRRRKRRRRRKERKKKKCSLGVIKGKEE